MSLSYVLFFDIRAPPRRHPDYARKAWNLIWIFPALIPKIEFISAHMENHISHGMSSFAKKITLKLTSENESQGSMETGEVGVLFLLKIILSNIRPSTKSKFDSFPFSHFVLRKALCQLHVFSSPKYKTTTKPRFSLLKCSHQFSDPNSTQESSPSNCPNQAQFLSLILSCWWKVDEV